MGTYLMHHGVRGMRWGVRRYQNADGSLTDAGKRRYSNGERAYKDLKKQVHSKRAKLIGGANRWMTGECHVHYPLQLLSDDRPDSRNGRGHTLCQYAGLRW